MKKYILILLAVILLCSCPLQAYASIGALTDFSCFGTSIETGILARKSTHKKDKNDEVRVVATTDSARIYVDKKHMNCNVEEYNLLLKSWEPLTFTNYGDFLQVTRLLPNTYHKIRITAGGKTVAKRVFYTNPESIKLKEYDVTKSFVTLNWENPHHYLTEIYKKQPEDNEWEMLAQTDADTFTDEAVEQDAHYSYRLRFACTNLNKTLYSVAAEYDEIYVPLEINNILKLNDYVVVRQNDPLNRTIPYPYKDNGKTLGSSGCGVCSSLMIILNMTKEEPKLESYTEKLIEIGARAPYGSDIYKIADYLQSEYKLKHSFTKDAEKLKEHLRDGKMAIAHVGKKKLFARSGHFVVIAGIVKDKDENERAIILDPTFAKAKYDVQRRVDAGIEYSDDGIVTAPFETVLEDCKDEYFTLFTAKK